MPMQTSAFYCFPPDRRSSAYGTMGEAECRGLEEGAMWPAWSRDTIVARFEKLHSSHRTSSHRTSTKVCATKPLGPHEASSERMLGLGLGT